MSHDKLDPQSITQQVLLPMPRFALIHGEVRQTSTEKIAAINLMSALKIQRRLTSHEGVDLRGDQAQARGRTEGLMLPR